jgi:diguanylate cyclase (GGDEF) domain
MEAGIKREFETVDALSEFLFGEAIYNSAPYISVFFNNRGEIIDCNPEAVRAFGFSSKSELRTALAENPENYFIEASPNSAEISLFTQVEVVFSDGDREFEAEIAAKDRRIPVSVIMKRIIFEDTTCVIAYMIDLSDLKQANLEILRHTQLFEAVNNVATTLLKNNLHILRNTKSLLLSPIIMQGDFWGFVGYSHRNANYLFSETEKGILRSAGLMIASGIIRSEISSSLVQAKTMASTDSLTQLPNRNSFMMQARSILEDHRESQEEVAILFLDIDHFKDVNDQYGHQFGDEVLTRFARAIQSNIRPGDLSCRYGGEEFLIMLVRPGNLGAKRLAQRIMTTVSALTFDKHPDFRFTTSIGLISAVPNESNTLEEFISKSDTALYEAKNTGRKKTVVYSE